MSEVSREPVAERTQGSQVRGSLAGASGNAVCRSSIAVWFFESFDADRGGFIAFPGGDADPLALAEIADLAVLAVFAQHLSVVGQRVAVLLAVLVFHLERLAGGADELARVDVVL